MSETDDLAIRVSGVKKTFRLPHEKHNSIKGLFINLFQRKRTFEKQLALNDISFEVKKGEFFGIVGRNGSGKSTLLKLLAGIYMPDKGSIDVEGKLTPFIELGVGFNPELTGRENVFLNGALLGFSRREMQDMYDQIVKFAELEKFMDQKLKNYSSGMQVRLAFAIAINAKAEILLLDEVLAVGDAQFQKKCFDYFRKLKKDKQTVVFISHDMNAVREYCDRVILVDSGSILASGKAEDVAQAYTKLFINSKPGENGAGSEDRWGSQEISITKINTEVQDRTVSITIDYKVNKDVANPILGLKITSPIGVKIFESNTLWKKIKTGSFKQGDRPKTIWQIPNIFTNGVNYITGAVASSDGLNFYDWWEDASSFIIDKDDTTTAVSLPDFKLKVE